MSLVALPETVRGLPLHALIVHGVVVLVPLVAIGTVLAALWPAARRHFGAFVVVAAAGATVLVPVTTDSGEDLERRLGVQQLVQDHAEWGERMLPAMLLLSASALALVLIDIVRRTGGTDGPAAARATAAPPTRLDRWLGARAPAGLRTASAERTLVLAERVVAVVAVLAALVALYVVFQTGESGAKAVWGGR